MRVAIVQSEIAPDLAAGLEKTRALATRATKTGAQLVAFPETWLPGYPAWLDSCRDAALWNHPPVKAEYARMAANSVDVGGDSGRALSAMARDLGVTLVVGVVERVSDGPGRGTLYNSMLTYGADGTLANHHRKLMPTYTERLVWGAGDANGLRTVDTLAGRVGGLICWEHWMPLARQALHDAGEDIHVAAWPTVHEMHQVASRHYAFEGRCFVLAAGSLMRTSALPRELELHPSHRGDWALRGGSAIFAPDGEVLAGPVFEREEIVSAEIDLTRVREESMTLDVSGHYARPDCFEFRPVRHPRASL
jgi:nitrilase